ncbi:histidine kinase/DNA gyrase B/HSP90-like ATPase [Chitinophaga dinghuensis]|uniref:histidine kinase n=1 Tax=Chitinophaga dinghuensis TaxID=1539050 RepID=A0A327VPW8_9BACT|nr:sensor histidine kinase [Chitinophaga dinghuensis]RAJ77281.1 histidine kinase/DNA gyrase B/HSP90-like ATPase [Chitinophaga dinghuensis]
MNIVAAVSNYPILRSIISIAIFLGVTVSSSGQDSVLSRIQRMPADTAKVNRLLAYATKILAKDDSTALQLSEQGLRLSEQLHYMDGMALAYRRIGYIKINRDDYPASIAANKMALHYAIQQKQLTTTVAACNNIGHAFRQMDKVDSAIAYYLQGIQAVENAKLTNDQQVTKGDVTATYAMLHTNITSLYCNMQNFSKAMEYGQKAIRIAGSVHDTLQLTVALVCTGHVYEGEKQFSIGMNYAREALALSATLNNPLVSSKIFHLIAVCYTGLKLPDSAILASKKVMAYTKGMDAHGYLSSFIDIADAYHLKEAYKQEEAILLAGIKELNVVNHSAFFGRHLYEKLANTQYALGNYRHAYEYLGKANNYKDSLMSKENRDAIANLESQYKTAMKEKELAQKDLQLQQHRNYMYFAIAGLIVALLLVVILIIQRSSKRKLHERKLETIQQQKELHLLQALMQGEERERSRIAKDLHDGVAGMLAATKMHFSSIPDADDLVNTEGYQQGMKLLNEATTEIRKTSHNLMPEVLLQYGLDEALRRYCNRVNNSKSMQIVYDSWGDISRYPDGFELSVYRIVQELINNIVKHSRATVANVQVSAQQNLLSVSIEDNGIGFITDDAKDGMGLKSLKSRVLALNGKMDIQTSEESGVCAYLEFEITTEKTENTIV